MRDELSSFVRNTAPLGLEYIRVEASNTSTIVYGADGIDKTIFMKAITKKPVKNLNGAFAVGDLALFLSLTNDSEFKTEGASVRLVKEEFKVFKKVDPDDDDSDTVEESEERPARIEFVDANGLSTSFRLRNAAMAPKAQLKNEPKWTATVELSFADPKLALFRQRASQFKSVEDKFRAKVSASNTDKDVSFLKFTIGQEGEHYTEVNICKFKTSDGVEVGNHAWFIDKILQVLSLTKDCDNFKIQMSKESGLMKITFNQYLGTKVDDKGKITIDTDGDYECENKITYEYIIPGKIVD